MSEQDTDQAQAADQIASGQAEGTQDKGEDKGKPFTPDQEQYIGSWMGRIIAKQFDEKVMPHLKQQPVQQPVVPTDDALKVFNDKVQEKLFSGDAVGAMEMVMNLKERTRQNLSNNQNINLMRGITTYSDKPYYEDVQADMQKLAKEKVANGWPVDAALTAAYSESKANFLESKFGDKESKGLNLSGGGKQQPRNKGAVKLPENFERACARDIADGIYKNREEWIKSLSPKIRESLGI